MIGCVFWIIGSTIICASQNIGMLIAGRVINGFAVGIESAQVPVYISEIAPPTKRGRLVAFQQWAITWGILILYYISYGTSFLGEDNSRNWNAAVFRIPWVSLYGLASDSFNTKNIARVYKWSLQSSFSAS